MLAFSTVEIFSFKRVNLSAFSQFFCFYVLQKFLWLIFCFLFRPQFWLRVSANPKKTACTRHRTHILLKNVQLSYFHWSLFILYCVGNIYRIVKQNSAIGMLFLRALLVIKKLYLVALKSRMRTYIFSNVFLCFWWIVSRLRCNSWAWKSMTSQTKPLLWLQKMLKLAETSSKNEKEQNFASFGAQKKENKCISKQRFLQLYRLSRLRYFWKFAEKFTTRLDRFKALKPFKAINPLKVATK